MTLEIRPVGGGVFEMLVDGELVRTVRCEGDVEFFAYYQDNSRSMMGHVTLWPLSEKKR